jgi:hypothetical protein
MSAIYRTLYPTGDGAQAADDLCSAELSTQGSGFPWTAFRASRLIPKHESEWANPAKWQALISAIGERTGPKPVHEEEKKRIAKLVWWDEVAAGVPGFPDSDVYHINPIGLVGNFFRSASNLDELIRKIGISSPAGKAAMNRIIPAPKTFQTERLAIRPDIRREERLLERRLTK